MWSLLILATLRVWGFLTEPNPVGAEAARVWQMPPDRRERYLQRRGIDSY